MLKKKDLLTFFDEFALLAIVVAECAYYPSGHISFGT
jgi:hypothetical protein